MVLSGFVTSIGDGLSRQTSALFSYLSSATFTLSATMSFANGFCFDEPLDKDFKFSLSTWRRCSVNRSCVLSRISVAAKVVHPFEQGHY